MPNWKAPGKDGVQGYCLKNFTSLHSRIAVQLNHILMEKNPYQIGSPLERKYSAKKTLQKEVQLITLDQYPACP